MKFRQMTTEDLEYMQNHSLNPEDRKIHVSDAEYSYTLEKDGVVLGIAGFKFINSTTAWCWLAMGEEARQSLTICFRTLSEWIPMFCKDFGIIRLEAYVEAGFEAGARLVQHLDFELESRMSNFIGFKPADRYVRFFKEYK